MEIREKLQIANGMTIYPDEFRIPDYFKLEYLNQIDTIPLVEKILAEGLEATIASAAQSQSQDEWSDSDVVNMETAANSRLDNNY